MLVSPHHLVPIGPVSVWMARPYKAKAMKREVCANQSGQWPGQAAKTAYASSLLYSYESKEIGRMLTKKQTDAFPKTVGENDNDSRKIKVKEQAPKLLILMNKPTRLPEPLHLKFKHMSLRCAQLAADCFWCRPAWHTWRRRRVTDGNCSFSLEIGTI